MIAAQGVQTYLNRAPLLLEQAICAGDPQAGICDPAAVTALAQGPKTLSVYHSMLERSLLAAMEAAPCKSASCMSTVRIMAAVGSDHGRGVIQTCLLPQIHHHMLIDQGTRHRAPSAFEFYPMEHPKRANSTLQPVLP